jgi:hypothetical protein
MRGTKAICRKAIRRDVVLSHERSFYFRGTAFREVEVVGVTAYVVSVPFDRKLPVRVVSVIACTICLSTGVDSGMMVALLKSK